MHPVKPLTQLATRVLADALDLYSADDWAHPTPQMQVDRFQRCLLRAAAAIAIKEIGEGFGCGCWVAGCTVLPNDATDRQDRIEAELVRRRAADLMRATGLVRLLPSWA